MIKPWIQAARLRTLPLAISGVLLGWAIHLPFVSEETSKIQSNGMVLFLAILTAVFLQVLSNFANDYGDFQKGTDQAAGRTDRAVSAGLITPSQMKMALFILSGLTFALGLFMLNYCGVLHSREGKTLLSMGILSIAAAIFYTVGKNAYGYLGLGDIMVLIFFGLLPVAGMGILLHVKWNLVTLLGGLAIGFLSTGVLNVNNYRDILSDETHGKKTFAVRLGASKTLIYHRLLMVFGGILFPISLVVLAHDVYNWISWKRLDLALVFGLFFPIYGLLNKHYLDVKSHQPGEREALNKQLKTLSLTSLLSVLIFVFVVLFFMA